ncbi:MAG: hypothetical protein GY866_31210 [Proteobacteria bacterium]|nr:hypothetical protein [Pseudomonadota bacterium]
MKVSMRIMRSLSRRLVFLGIVLALASCNENLPGHRETATDVTLTSIQVAPTDPVLVDPSIQQLTATGTYSNGASRDITSSVYWISEDPTKVTVSDATDDAANPRGQAKTVFTGSTKITARSGNVRGFTTVTVTSTGLASIQITPGLPSLPFSLTPSVQFQATGIYADGTVVDLTEYATWDSDSTDDSVATINNTSGKRGLASSVAQGATEISATYQSVVGRTILELNSATRSGPLQFSPVNPVIAKGTSQHFRAVAILSNGKSYDVTDKVVWTSDQTDIASISNSLDSIGLASADTTTDGTTDIYAAYDDVSGDATRLNVTSAYLFALQIYPANPKVAFGTDHTFKALGIFKYGSAFYHQDLTDSVVWFSSNTDVASICNAAECKGKITTTDIPSVLKRTATITAKSALSSTVAATTTLTLNPPRRELIEIQVTPANPLDYLGSQRDFTATGIYYDGVATSHQDVTNFVIWRSSDETVAVVGNQKNARGKTAFGTAGETTITASLGTVSGISLLTVMPASMALESIEIVPVNPSIVVGLNSQLKAIGIFSDGSATKVQDLTEFVVWSSDSSGDARGGNAGDSKGLVTGLSASDVTIKATLEGDSATAGSAVLNTFSRSPGDYEFSALEISPTTTSVPAGSRLQFTATGVFKKTGAELYKLVDMTDTVTWMSSKPINAEIDNSKGSAGQAMVLASGSTTIKAVWAEAAGLIQAVETTLTIDSMPLQYIEIWPRSAALTPIEERQFTAVGIYSDTSVFKSYDLTRSVTWRSGDPSSNSVNAPVSNVADSRGLVRFLNQGFSSITVTYEDGNGDVTSDGVTLTAGGVTLSSMTVSPTAKEIVSGATQQFKAFRVYPDGSTREITERVKWSSKTSEVAVSNEPGRRGLATSSSANATVATITAGADDGSSEDATLNVRGGAFTALSLNISPSTPTIGAGTTMQLDVSGDFDSGTFTSDDYADFVYWVSSDPTVVAVGNTEGTKGVLRGISTGSATITAKCMPLLISGLTACTESTAAVTVVNGTPDSLAISPEQVSLSVGGSQQLSGMATFSGDATQDVTESAVWFSSDPAVVAVSNASGSKGKASAISSGSAYVKVRLEGVFSIIEISVQ